MAREYTTIVLHIAADRAPEFEALFERDELKRWDDYTKRGRFVEARLIKCDHSGLQNEGVQDYVLQVVTIVLNSIEATMQTEGLLKQSQQLAVELQMQQGELQQTNEQLEMKAQQLAERKASGA